MFEQTKRCPFCAETIKAEAVICRFCGKELDFNTAKASKKKKDSKLKGCLFVVGSIFLVLILLVILLDTSLPDTTSEDAVSRSESESSEDVSSGTERGWLCDYDKTGSIRLWTAASMNATVKDTVGTCTGCCVDVNMYEKKSVEGILFYRISVGGQSGWVDVDYYYPDWLGKPDWSTN